MDESTIEFGSVILKRHQATFRVRLEGLTVREIPSAVAIQRMVASIERSRAPTEADLEGLPLLLQNTSNAAARNARRLVSGVPVRRQMASAPPVLHPSASVSRTADTAAPIEAFLSPGLPSYEQQQDTLTDGNVEVSPLKLVGRVPETMALPVFWQPTSESVQSGTQNTASSRESTAAPTRIPEPESAERTERSLTTVATERSEPAPARPSMVDPGPSSAPAKSLRTEAAAVRATPITLSTIDSSEPTSSASPGMLASPPTVEPTSVLRAEERHLISDGREPQEQVIAAAPDGRRTPDFMALPSAKESAPATTLDVVLSVEVPSVTPPEMHDSAAGRLPSSYQFLEPRAESQTLDGISVHRAETYVPSPQSTANIIAEREPVYARELAPSSPPVAPVYLAASLPVQPQSRATTSPAPPAVPGPTPQAMLPNPRTEADLARTVDVIAAEVMRRFTREVSLEAERRGVDTWEF